MRPLREQDQPAVREEQAGNIALADGVFSESTGVNGVIAGMAGPKRRLHEPLVGFPELSIHIVDMFSAGDKLLRVSFGGGSCLSLWGAEAAGRPVTAADFAAGAPRAAK